MNRREESLFLEKSKETLASIGKWLGEAKTLTLKEIDPKKTAWIIVDMNNGFAKEGALMSDRVKALIPKLTKFSSECDRLAIRKLAMSDHHRPDSVEFSSYPPHCVSGTAESEIVDELKAVGGYTLIQKNSTNGFLEAAFQDWLKGNEDIETWILSGDCTDICILQLATTIKAWLNQQDRKGRVIVAIDHVDTYDFGDHHGELMNLFSFYNMHINGVEIVKEIQLK